jgi:hypothetical protein
MTLDVVEQVLQVLEMSSPWELHILRELSDRERQLYKRVH